MKHIQLTESEKSALLLQLTADKRENFDQALAELEKTLADNYTNSQAQLEKTGKQAVTNQASKYNQTLKAPVLGKLELENSSLFQRFLAGKSALPYPPPNSFGLPWYDIVENDNAFIVSLGDAAMVNSKFNLSNNPNSKLNQQPESVIINQHAWPVVDKNPAAVALFDYIEQAKQQELAASKIKAISELLSNSPEVILSYPNYGDYKLFIATGEKTLTRLQLDNLANWYFRYCSGTANYHAEAIDHTNELNVLKVTGRFWHLQKCQSIS